MNKTEIAEIKKLFKKEDNGITRICGCYVDAEKNKRVELKEAFYSLPDEEIFKYVDIFRKTLSGTIGRTLINMEFPVEEEMKEDGKQKFLLDIVKSKLENNDLLDRFYDMVIDSYEYTGNYFIILIHDAYDIPSVTADGPKKSGGGNNHTSSQHISGSEPLYSSQRRVKIGHHTGQCHVKHGNVQCADDSTQS